MLKTLVTNLISFEKIGDWTVKKISDDNYYEAWKSLLVISGQEIMLPIPTISEDLETDNNIVLITGWNAAPTSFNVSQGYKDRFTIHHNANISSRKITIYLRVKYKN